MRNARRAITQLRRRADKLQRPPTAARPPLQCQLQLHNNAAPVIRANQARQGRLDKTENMEQMVSQVSQEPQVKLRPLDSVCRRLVNGLAQRDRQDSQANRVPRDLLEMVEMMGLRLHPVNQVHLDLLDPLDRLESLATLGHQEITDNLAKT